MGLSWTQTFETFGYYTKNLQKAISHYDSRKTYYILIYLIKMDCDDIYIIGGGDKDDGTRGL